MKTLKDLLSEAENKWHPKGVYAIHQGGGVFKVHATGKDVPAEHVKAGDTIRSSDLDDLHDAGYRVKEMVKPGRLRTTPTRKS